MSISFPVVRAGRSRSSLFTVHTANDQVLFLVSYHIVMPKQTLASRLLHRNIIYSSLDLWRTYFYGDLFMASSHSIWRLPV